MFNSQSIQNIQCHLLRSREATAILLSCLHMVTHCDLQTVLGTICAFCTEEATCYTLWEYSFLLLVSSKTSFVVVERRHL